MNSYKTNAAVNDCLDKLGFRHARLLRRAVIVTLHGVVVFALLSALAVFSAQTARAQTLNTLYAFTGGVDGGKPYAGVIRDAKGNLYGTTSTGGAYGYGTVFEVTPAGTYTVLYSFLGSPDGAHPYGALVRDSKGNLFGTTPEGGIAGGVCNANCGTVFELVRTGKTYTEKVLYAFAGGADGANPYAGLVRDSKGNLYGTTVAYGSSNCVCGTVFKLSPDGTMTTLYQFGGGTDGANPYGVLARDAKGNLYGTTEWGGDLGCTPIGCGTVFEVSATGAEKVLHSFTGEDGAEPFAGLVRDAKGNLYGTATWGGTYGTYGTVFELTKKGTFTVLHNFAGGDPGDGINPNASLVRDKQGNLYGTTFGGGYNYGTVFEVTPTGSETVLYGFIARADGSSPYGSLVLDGQGNLYGTAEQGGDYGYGTVFKLTP